MEARLEHNIQVFITAENDTERAEWAEKFAFYFAHEYGGATIEERNRGYWVDNVGIVVREPVIIVSAWSDRKIFIPVKRIEEYKKEARQQCTFAVIDGVAHII